MRILLSHIIAITATWGTFYCWPEWSADPNRAMSWAGLIGWALFVAFLCASLCYNPKNPKVVTSCAGGKPLLSHVGKH
jgi:hypothetical protein